MVKCISEKDIHSIIIIIIQELGASSSRSRKRCAKISIVFQH